MKSVYTIERTKYTLDVSRNYKETGKQRTLWRTHLVVCRRCKAKAESLRQTDRDACKVTFVQSSPYIGLRFLFFKEKGKR